MTMTIVHCRCGREFTFGTSRHGTMSMIAFYSPPFCDSLTVSPNGAFLCATCGAPNILPPQVLEAIPSWKWRYTGSPTSSWTR